MTNAKTPAPTTPSVRIPLAGIDEILDLMLQISRERVLQLTFRGDFPEPAAELAAGDIWRRDDVEGWISEHGDAVADMLKETR